MRIRIVYRDIGEGRDRDFIPWSEFLFEYRVKEYIWEKIAEGDTTSLKEFGLATVHCHACGVLSHQCQCMDSNAGLSDSGTVDNEIELLIRHEPIWNYPLVCRIFLWVSSTSIASAIVPRGVFP